MENLSAFPPGQLLALRPGESLPVAVESRDEASVLLIAVRNFVKTSIDMSHGSITPTTHSASHAILNSITFIYLT